MLAKVGFMEQKPKYFVSNTKVIDDLLEILNPDQIILLTAELKKIIDHGYGILSIRVEDDDLYILPAISIQAGKVEKT